jgi:hypothetical protein
LNTLKLLNVKQKHNLSNQAFNEILDIFTDGKISLHTAKTKLSDLVNINPIFIDVCINSCCAFTGLFINNTTCQFCNEARYIINKKKKKSRKVMSFFSLIDRFKIQYNNPDRSMKLRYRHQYITSNNYNENKYIGDIFDGNLYKELVNEGFFANERDIALIGSTDGYQIFKQKTDDCWVIMFINANLSPLERVKKDNLLISAIIPGPTQPKHFNSFLKPIVDELKILDGKI